MNKYQKLTKEYHAEIAEIKALKANFAAMVERADDDDSAETLYQEAEIVYQDLVDRSQELQTHIEAAYSAAPFAKTQADGIAKFYKLAGLD